LKNDAFRHVCIDGYWAAACHQELADVSIFKPGEWQLNSTNYPINSISIFIVGFSCKKELLKGKQLLFKV